MAAQVYQATLQQMDVLSYNVRGFRLKLVEPTHLAFRPGQFVVVHIPKGGSTVKRAYSIASPPHEQGAIELCVQLSKGGTGSTFFWELEEGAPLTISGPHGSFLMKEPLTYEPVFMTTGTGVAPLRSMAKHLYHLNVTQQVWLLFGFRYEHAILYDSEFRTLASLRHNFHYLPTVSRPKEWRGEVGYVQQTLQKHIHDFSNKEFYVCGWLEIVKEIAKDLANLGIPKERIHFEQWT